MEVNFRGDLLGRKAGIRDLERDDSFEVPLFWTIKRLVLKYRTL